MANQWFTANEILFLSGVKHDLGQGLKMERRACLFSVSRSSLPHSLLNRKASPGNGNSHVTHTNSVPTPSHLLCLVFFFSGVPVKLLTTDQSSQAFLCREHDLSGKKKAAVIALSCPRSSYRVPTPLFNQRSFLVSFQLCYPQNYPVIIKSYHFSIVQVSVSLVVFQSLFTWALPNTYSLFHNPLPPLFPQPCFLHSWLPFQGLCRVHNVTVFSVVLLYVLDPIASLILQFSMIISRQFVIARLSHPNRQRWECLQMHLSRSLSSCCALLNIIPV